MLTCLLFHRLLEHREDERNRIDKRLEDNEKALKLALEEGVEFMDNVKITVEKRLVDRRKFEKACDDGKQAQRRLVADLRLARVIQLTTITPHFTHDRNHRNRTNEPRTHPPPTQRSPK